MEIIQVEVKDPIVTQHPSINITSEPSDVSIIEEGTATFSVSAITRGDVTYQWYQNTVESDTTGTAIDNANSSSYTTEVLNKDSRNIYFYCEITATLNGETVTKKTRVAKANIFGKVEIAGDENTEKVVLEGEDASFEITASGEGELSYQWYKNTTNSNTGGTLIEHATAPNYTIDSTTVSMSGTYYYCEITQEYRGQTAVVKTNPAMLTVVSKVTITKNPTAVSSIAGKGSVSFSVTASGAGTLSYQWYYKTSSSGAGNLISGATGSTYTINAGNLSIDLSGRYYYCVVTQKYGAQTQTQTSTSALLTLIQPATITSQPQNITVTEGKEATFSVTVNGLGNLSYQWYKTTENSSSGGEAISNATSSSYTIKSASTDMNGTYYYCIVTQKYGTPNQVSHEVTSEVAQLTIGTKVSVSRPTSVNTIENTKDVTFTVKATGEGTFKYQWYKNTSNSNTGGSAISGANSATYTIPKANVTTSLNNTYYYCVVTQTYGSSTKTATSGTAQLTVIAGVTIKTQPTAQSVYESKPASFTVEVNGGGTITYQWYSNSSNSTSGGSPISGATNAKYTISSTTSSLNGKYYYCIITQKYGSPTTATATVTTTPVKLTVTTTTITANPTSITV